MRAEPVSTRPHGPLSPRTRRAFELLLPRLPHSVIRLAGRLLRRLPRASRARRWYVLTLSQYAWDATARTRFDLVLPIWDSACEWHWDLNFRALGFEEVYRGHEGVRRSLQAWNEIWTELTFTVREVLDGGDTLVLRMAVAGRGLASGVPTGADSSIVVRLDPLIVDFRVIADDAEALREAGFA
jgi:hypothetical protein